MKKKLSIQQSFLLGLFIGILILPRLSPAENLENLKRFANSLPVFVSYANIQATNGVLIVGIFSDESSMIDQKVLDIFKNLKPWNSKPVKEITQHESIKIIALNKKELDDFQGQVIWVLDADASLKSLRSQTEKGVFTIGVQNSNYTDYLFTTLIYENKSSDPQINKWRLEELIANCGISPLRFSQKLFGKSYFSPKSCD